nr:serine/threonine-protein kinase SAPK2-like [Ipomoea batatas]
MIFKISAKKEHYVRRNIPFPVVKIKTDQLLLQQLCPDLLALDENDFNSDASANWEKEGRSLNSISGDEGPLLNHLLEPMERKKSEGKRRSKWKRPPETTLKLNMDSALAKETRTTRVGAIIRDHNGQFVAAMVKTARSSTLYPKGLHMLSQLQVSSRVADVMLVGAYPFEDPDDPRNFKKTITAKL